jgi:hypothetical protein
LKRRDFLEHIDLFLLAIGEVATAGALIVNQLQILFVGWVASIDDGKKKTISRFHHQNAKHRQ